MDIKSLPVEKTTFIPTDNIRVSGFPKRSESVYDTFGVGHSSTSISGALGMAVASQYNGEKDKQHIAVIGDGSMTAGIAFEGLNHAGIENSNLLVILMTIACLLILQLARLKNTLQILLLLILTTK